jgi:hypothetical protein
MFTKKQQAADIIKKSSAKVQDSKKDVFARLKHLKTILGESSVSAKGVKKSCGGKERDFMTGLAKNLDFA